MCATRVIPHGTLMAKKCDALQRIKEEECWCYHAVVLDVIYYGLYA